METASGTLITTTVQKITDEGGNTWSFNEGGRVVLNGKIDLTTANVEALGYFAGQVWQFTSARLWWYKNAPHAPWLPAQGTPAGPFYSIKANFDSLAAQLQAIAVKVDTLTEKVTTGMSQLDDEIAALQADVAAEGVAVDSAVVLINGFSAQLAAAIAAAQAAGATAVQLAAFTSLDTAIKAQTAGLAAAVTANTPPTPTPVPTPAPTSAPTP